MPPEDLRPTPPPRIEFVEHHLPALKDGEYTITLTQTLTANADTLATVRKDATFAVQGARFSLAPGEISALFPPPGSLGDHANVLPHIVLTRSTLPWERRAQTGREDIPWLALLVLEEAEIVPAPGHGQEQLQTLPLGQLTAADPNFGWPGLEPEIGQAEDLKINVVDVKAEVIKQLMPTATELRYLAHVRQGLDDRDEVVGPEVAILIANRLPKPGATSFVHLVSVEGRYRNGTFDLGDRAPAAYRFVSLKHWRFSCLAGQPDFSALLKRLVAQNGSPKAPNTLRLPAPSNAPADAQLLEPYLARGYVLLRHFLRDGDKTVSLYRGPLIPGDGAPTRVAEFPVAAADELVRFHDDMGIFDESYAAAWELGRLLALRSKSFSVALAQWKRSHAQQVRQVEQAEQRPHLPFHATTAPALHLPEAVEGWLSDLSRLKGLPFNYIVPDPRMLPVESIRFFQVDPHWVAALIDGAFSLGRVTARDGIADRAHRRTLDALHTETVSGFLLRSAAVAGWPGLLADGYGDAMAADSLPLWRMERLAPDVLLCLFQGDLHALDLHLQPELLHFGFDREESAGSGMTKSLRMADGSVPHDSQGNVPPERIVNLRTSAGGALYRDATMRTLQIAALYDEVAAKSTIAPFTPAHFAMLMTEGVERIRFLRNPKD